MEVFLILQLQLPSCSHYQLKQMDEPSIFKSEMVFKTKKKDGGGGIDRSIISTTCTEGLMRFDFPNEKILEVDFNFHQFITNELENVSVNVFLC